MLKIKNLSKKIQGKTILDDLSFQIAPGSIAIFLGGSGVGKSTLLRVLNNLEGYDSGSFTLENAPLDIKSVNQKHTVGMVFQHFNLFEHLSAEENIMLALTTCKGMEKEKAREIALQFLKRYGLEDKAKMSVHKISGGQKQRLAIARTLALDPKIICLDEPTSALDPRLTAQVAKWMTELAAEGRIVLLTTHDMGLLEFLEGQLFLMEKGSIVESAVKSASGCNFASFPKLHSFLKGV